MGEKEKKKSFAEELLRVLWVIRADMKATRFYTEELYNMRKEEYDKKKQMDKLEENYNAKV